MTKNYVRRGSLLDVQPAPWRSEAGEGFVFGIGARQDSLQALCDRVLNAPLGLPPQQPRYRAASDGVLLTVQRFQGVHSIGVPASEAIRYDYCEAAFWVALDYDGETQDAFFLPYVFLDAALPAAVGRELYGFAKEVAKVSMADDGSRFEVEALVWDGAGTPAVQRPLLTIERASPVAVAAAPMVASANAFLPENRHLLQRAGNPAALASTRFAGLLQEFVFLRQFASPQQAGADLQQVVHAPFTLEPQTLDPVGEDYRLTLHPALSHPMASDLGITLDARNGLDVPAVGIWKSRFNFELGAATAVSP